MPPHEHGAERPAGAIPAPRPVPVTWRYLRLPPTSCTSNLPRFDKTGGIARMLATVDAVHLTALPRAYTAQVGTPQRLKRRQLERLGDAEIDPPAPGWPDCYVVLSVAADGSARLDHGPGSVQITESGGRDRPRRRVVRPRGGRSWGGSCELHGEHQLSSSRRRWPIATTCDRARHPGRPVSGRARSARTAQQGPSIWNV